MQFVDGKPYIFISYAHKDSDKVLPIISALENYGFNVWFDGGIEAGSEWPKMIAQKLKNCACVIAFVSKAYVVSDNCLREFTYTQNKKKPVLSAFLDIEWDELPEGIDMQLTLCQSIMMKNFSDEKSFQKAICSANFLIDSGAYRGNGDNANTQNLNVKPIETVEKVEEVKSTETDNSIEEEVPVKTPRYKAINTTFVLLHLAYFYVCIVALLDMPSNAGDIFLHTVKSMAIPLAIIIIAGRIIIKTFGKELTKAQKDEISTNSISCFMIVMIASFVVGMFIMPTGLNFILNLLISLLVNLFIFIVGCVPMAML